MYKHRKKITDYIKGPDVHCIFQNYEFCVIIACITGAISFNHQMKAVSRNSWSILEEVRSMGRKLFVRLHYFAFETQMC